MGKYPDCFPSDFESRILPKEAKCECISVYRIAADGVNNRDAFKGSYEKDVDRGIPEDYWLKHDESDPGLYSTSCFEDIKDARRILKMIMRHNPAAIILKGTTDYCCGLCQRTRDRKKLGCRKSHVDWWVYKNSAPQNFFKEETREDEAG